MEINYRGESLELSDGFSIDIEETSPIFNDEGSQSVSATVPTTPHNSRLFRFPFRLDTVSECGAAKEKAEVTDGLFRRSGVINVTESRRRNGISFNIGFDNSTAYSSWIDKKLKDLSNLPEIRANVDYLINMMTYLYQDGSSFDDDLAVFPVALGKSVTDEGEKTEKTYWELINAPDSEGSMSQPETVERLLDNTATEISVPKGYGLSPFLRVWRVLELLFADLGVEMVDNPFRERTELQRLVVLNNVADAICSGTLKYSELLPDCTVGEFMESLWVRFGLVYRVDSQHGTVTLRFLKEILETEPGMMLDGMESEEPDITWEQPQHIVLSSSTGLEGAEPATERFEDFIRGLNLSELHVGQDVSNWKRKETGNGWDGEFADGPEWEPEYPEGRDPDDIPDPWDDYDRDNWDDDRDDGRSARSTRSSSGYATSIQTSKDTWLGRETVTGRWWKLDAINGDKKESSSSFFRWDPDSEGTSPMELTGQDECVPVMKVDTGFTNVGNYFNGYAPGFLTGPRHFHSYIKGNDKEKDGDSETPLAFIWAYPVAGSKTIGRDAPEAENGHALEIKDGGEPGPTLYYQFADGLFANYWREYDEILRHGFRKVELKVNIPKMTLQNLDILRPVVYRGCLCLFDRIEYRLPAPAEIKANVTLRTIMPIGEYDIEKEQNIPGVAMTALGLGWAFYECNWQDVEDAKQPEMEREAFLRFKELYGHLESVEDSEALIVDPMGITATGNWIEEIPLTWPTDEKMPAPGATKTVRFRGRVYYDLRMVRRVWDPVTDDPISKEAVGDVVGTLYVDYTFDAKYICTYLVRR